MIRGAWILGAAALALAGCGDTSGDRAVSGAGIGAATGAVLGAVTGMTVLQGAVIGAAGGAVVGAVTDKSTLNIGDPVWKGQSRSAAADPGAAADGVNVAAAQAGLTKLGYDAGPADGVAGRRTREAVKRFQQDRGMAADGLLTAAVAQRIATEAQQR